MDFTSVLRTLTPTYVWPVKFCLAITATTYILSIVTGNASQVDRVWTFLPTIYTAYYALMPLWPRESPTPLFPFTPKEVDPSITNDFNPRALLMLALVVTWMFRLSYNTWRRGLFNLNDEDYRWEILRQKLPPWLFQVFNLGFIAIAQNIILFLLGIPTQIAVTQPHTALSSSDYVLGTIGFLSIAAEFVADNQQYSFQTYKRTGKVSSNEWPGARINWTPEDAKRGFVTRGLWAWSRHPNFMCEQSFWIVINLFPLLSPTPPNLTFPPTSIASLAPLAPCLVLCTLFFSSTKFTEGISLSKYPVAYSAYKRRVGMCFPLTTLLWGLLLHLQGEKDEVDRIVYGSGEAKKSE